MGNSVGGLPGSGSEDIRSILVIFFTKREISENHLPKVKLVFSVHE
jgi:hypothetical protein